jgi:hypothetical protein
MTPIWKIFLTSGLRISSNFYVFFIFFKKFKFKFQNSPILEFGSDRFRHISTNLWTLVSRSQEFWNIMLVLLPPVKCRIFLPACTYVGLWTNISSLKFCGRNRRRRPKLGSLGENIAGPHGSLAGRCSCDANSRDARLRTWTDFACKRILYTARVGEGTCTCFEYEEARACWSETGLYVCVVGARPERFKMRPIFHFAGGSVRLWKPTTGSRSSCRKIW